MAKNIEVEARENDRISQGTTIKGEISSNGDIRFDGNLDGNLTANGKLVVGQSGELKGEIKCKNADISGKVEGKITVSELLTLKASSKINGDITTGKLAIEPGASFTGNCNMNGSKNMTLGGKETEKA